MAKKSADHGVIVQEIGGDMPPSMTLQDQDQQASSVTASAADPPPGAGSEADLRAEVARLQAELARVTGRDKPMPDTGPGRFRVLIRHTPAPIKRLVCDAANEGEAWSRLLAANEAKSKESKKLAVFWDMAKGAIAAGAYERSFQRTCPDCKEAWTDNGAICDECNEIKVKAERELRAKRRAAEADKLAATV